MFDIIHIVKNLNAFNFLKNKERLWWANAGTFHIVLDAVLTQNTNYNNVLKAKENLKTYNIISLEDVANVDVQMFSTLIKPSGFYKQKAPRLKQIAQNILKDFNTFENFKEKVDRNWLLKQKGIGKESADAILNYACFKDSLVVDKYTLNFLKAFLYDFNEYDELKDFLEYEILKHLEEIKKELKVEEVYEVYALFHALVVEYCKIYHKKNSVKIVF